MWVGINVRPNQHDGKTSRCSHTHGNNNTIPLDDICKCAQNLGHDQTRVTLTEFRHGQRMFGFFLSMLKTWTRPRASAGTLNSHILTGRAPFWSWRRGARSPLGPCQMGGTLLKEDFGGRLSCHRQAHRACGRLGRSGVCGATAS